MNKKESREEFLKRMIKTKYGTYKIFCIEIGMPQSTLSSVLNRGIGSASFDTGMRISKALGISLHQLLDDGYSELTQESISNEDDKSDSKNIIKLLENEDLSSEDIRDLTDLIMITRRIRKRANRIDKEEAIQNLICTLREDRDS